ncbi:NUDIX hydrolase [Bacillus suaedaesalsae]|uniref:NUDIX hydrolase n=1 Tax=Bacillus suaedaesalsae TaxID=2810349 RepID=A0ABS2DK21_9BACI|nr:NUDIX hydrolase [Bacillus suaedaesalsae]MBM6618818.1 NUDIX hydrolase [Bacillus suaedaesalsae]
MISQGFIMKINEVLMVKQYVERGDIVWNFPGGSIEEGETPQEACVREVKEETGFDVEINELLYKGKSKYTYTVKIVSGLLELNKELKDNNGIIDVQWISIFDKEKWDDYTLPILQRFQEKDDV